MLSSVQLKLRKGAQVMVKVSIVVTKSKGNCGGGCGVEHEQ